MLKSTLLTQCHHVRKWLRLSRAWIEKTLRHYIPRDSARFLRGLKSKLWSERSFTPTTKTRGMSIHVLGARRPSERCVRSWLLMVGSRIEPFQAEVKDHICDHIDGYWRSPRMKRSITPSCLRLYPELDEHRGLQCECFLHTLRTSWL